MHSANLQPLHDYFEKNVHEAFEVETYTTRLDAKNKGIDGDCDKVYMRPNGKARAREISKKTYAVSYPLALVFQLSQIRTDVAEVVEYFKNLIHLRGDTAYTAWDDFNEEIYMKETGKKLKNRESRFGIIEFNWNCLENICAQTIKLECKK